MFKKWNFATTHTFNNITTKKTQIEYYMSQKSSPEILKLVKLGNRQFGCCIEKIIREMLRMNTSKDTTCDGLFYNIRIEIKASRYWIGQSKPDFKWQHIEPNHKFDLIIFVAVMCQKIDLYVLSYNKVLELIQQNIIRKQGGGTGQGFWCSKKEIRPFLTKLSTTLFKQQLLMLSKIETIKKIK